MKKLILPVLMLAIAMSASQVNAQQKKNFISGGISYNSSKNHQEGVFSDQKNTMFSVAPSYGRYLNEKFSIGVTVAYNYVKTGRSINQNPAKSSGASFGPFVRFEQPLWNSKVSVYSEAGITAGFGKTTTTYENPNYSITYKNNSFGVYYTPGLMFNFRPRVAVLASLGSLFSIQHTVSKPEDEKSKITATTAGITSGFGLNSIQFGFMFRF
ncbi:outer membrane protein with beta-barrel domain [Chitinophaga niastensis]|uniref:Outer membrane protein with beta-barrel domain n=1 Tax=Chitinophaga niastensis TaxID=536980 RepID=A0A2P8H8D9_CHINA|nr:outer membrane beta-barrel protein [Chitinophaga niastensis]PSL42488.1 outer membrane protein with beta-barrel domain [Chitinophaga niastensis]